MRLTLDHVILRAADPAATLAELAERIGAPVLVPVLQAGAFTSGIVRASVDIEVLAIGAEPPPGPLGYGLGFTADVSARHASTRCAGAASDLGATGATADGRSGRAVQVHGLLPDPFPAPTFEAQQAKERPPRSAAGALAGPRRWRGRHPQGGGLDGRRHRVPLRRRAWRAGGRRGPRRVAVEVGTAGHDWSQLPIGPARSLLDPDGPPASAGSHSRAAATRSRSATSSHIFRNSCR